MHPGLSARRPILACSRRAKLGAIFVRFEMTPAAVDRHPLEVAARVQPRAMPLNTKHRFLISPELGNQFILVGAARRQFATLAACLAQGCPPTTTI
jgi:hypothetical protein